jgi:hypothetical protein
MSTHYGKEKFHMALMCLVEPGDIHSRVTAALAQHLLHLNEQQDLPQGMREEFSKLRNSLDAISESKGHASEAINGLSQAEVEKIAQQIVVLQEKLLSSS